MFDENDMVVEMDEDYFILKLEGLICGEISLVGVVVFYLDYSFNSFFWGYVDEVGDLFVIK